MAKKLLCDYLFIFLPYGTMNLEFTWKITYISAIEKVGANETEKLTFVLEQDNEEYPNSLSLDLFWEKVEKMKYKVGDVITAKYNTRAKEYKGRYFNNINARMLKWENVQGTQTDVAKATKSTGAQASDDIFG